MSVCLCCSRARVDVTLTQFLTTDHRLSTLVSISEISRIPVKGRFGTKLDFLVRFLLKIDRTTEDKTLIFSSFSRGLDYVGEALKRNSISHVRLEGGMKGPKAVEQFRNDPSVNVLLLHSEAQSSGLNLLCATNVIILEPLVNHAMELQAISRVSRIGATRITQIYTLYIKGTVEERILQLAAAKNRSLYVVKSEQEEDGTDVALLDAKSRAGKDAKKGDFVSDPSDLHACLFDEKSPVSDSEVSSDNVRRWRPLVEGHQT